MAVPGRRGRPRRRRAHGIHGVPRPPPVRSRGRPSQGGRPESAGGARIPALLCMRCAPRRPGGGARSSCACGCCRRESPPGAAVRCPAPPGPARGGPRPPAGRPPWDRRARSTPGSGATGAPAPRRCTASRRSAAPPGRARRPRSPPRRLGRPGPRVRSRSPRPMPRRVTSTVARPPSGPRSACRSCRWRSQSPSPGSPPRAACGRWRAGPPSAVLPAPERVSLRREGTRERRRRRG
ncbi:hypothetical protein SPURM210S_04868 [Streptomyces purpurascens]